MEKTEKKGFVILKSTPDSACTVAMSTDREKIAERMKSEILGMLEEMHGKKEDIDPEDDFVLELFETAEKIDTGTFLWSDADDEYPITFSVETTEIL